MTTTADSEIRVEHTDGVLRVILDRPDQLNALTLNMLTRAAAAIERGGADPDVRVIMLTGAGKAFSSGADLAGGGDGESTDAQDVADAGTIDAANHLTMAMRRAPKPVIAAINGPAAGVGCSFAVAADITLAKESSYFLLAFANVGLMPDGGATALIPAAIGRARAVRMAMLAERIPAAQALEWGLIAQVVPDDDFPAEVDKLATRLAEGPTQSYARSKRAINATTLDRLPDAFESEREGQTRLFRSNDFAEGIAAFREKRAPRFTGE